MIHDAVTRDILMDVILHVFLKLRRQITETQVAFLVIPGNDLSARPFLGIFLNPFGDLVVGRTVGDDRTKIAVINFGKIQPALIERAIGVVSAVPIQKYCAAFVHGARRQYITCQCGSRTTRKLFSIPQITREQFHFFEVLSRHVLFLLFLHPVTTLRSDSMWLRYLIRSRSHNHASAELRLLLGEAHLFRLALATLSAHVFAFSNSY